MQKIYKYEIPISGGCIIGLPEGARILKFGKQDHVYFIWALVNTNVEFEYRTFKVIGTGHPLENDFQKTHVYIDTCIENDGPFVWHLWEEIKF
jgi:hypothetical protein